MQAVPLGLGLGASAILLADYSSAAPALCAVGGGCDQVRQSALAHIAGVPTPLLGVMFFAALILLQAVRGWRRVRLPLAVSGAAVALVLLGVQAWSVGAFCKFCVVVDLSALAYLGLLLATSRPTAASPPFVRGAFVSLATAALFCLAVVATAPSAATPSAAGNLAALAPTNSAARLTITEFVDFQCPACRSLHRELTSALSQLSEPIEVVRHHLPLAQHAHAATAARAYCCAEESGQADAMADQLFTAQSLSEADCENMAAGVGVDRDVYRQCMESSAPAATIETDAKLAKEFEVRALPTFFVGTRRVEGARSSAELVAMIEGELANTASP